MLTEIHIEALLVDEELADQVWEAWDAGKTGDRTVPTTRTAVVLQKESGQLAAFFA